MKRVSSALLILALATVAGLYAWAHVRSEFPRPLPDSAIIAGPTSHLVTPAMATASRAMLDRPAPGFSKPASDGRTYSLDRMLADGPVLLNFIKDGCPCSDAAQLFFNDLHAAYPKATMRGVINVESGRARRWAENHRVTYPVLVDPAQGLMRDYGAENSAYVVLVGPDGGIVKHWPGFSEPMLRELGSLVAGLTGSAEKPLNLADAPEELYSGCPFEF